MGGIKRTPADAAFSLCIKLRAGFRCERCGTQHAHNSMGLHCSHHIRRGEWGVRFDPLNAEALCYGCHSLVGGTGDRMEEVLTEHELGLLQERRNDTSVGRECRKTKGKGAIAKHYREEAARLQRLRDEGETGRLEFVGWV